MDTDEPALVDQTLFLDCETDCMLHEAGYSSNPAFARSREEDAFERRCALGHMRVSVCVTKYAGARSLPVAHLLESTREQAESVQRELGDACTVVAGADLLVAEMDAARALCAWNAAFDLGVLEKYAKSPKHLTAAAWTAKTIDPMVQIAASVSGQYLSLNEAAGESKTGTGQQAVAWLRSGRWTELVSYCVQDVLLLESVAAPLLRGETRRLPVAVNLVPGEWQKAATRSISTQTPLAQT